MRVVYVNILQYTNNVRFIVVLPDQYIGYLEHFVPNTLGNYLNLNVK